MKCPACNENIVEISIKEGKKASDSDYAVIRPCGCSIKRGDNRGVFVKVKRLHAKLNKSRSRRQGRKNR